jgi:hypothetical protein
VDYYQLAQTALYIFSAPNSRVEIRQGLRQAKMVETDAEGNLLVNSLDFLQPICLDEETVITLRSGGLESRFTIRWAPLLQELTIEDGVVIARYNGPEDTAVRLWLRRPSGDVLWQQDLPCQGEEVTDEISLPVIRAPLAYLVAGYVLLNGDVRSAAWQLSVEGEAAHQIPEEWLLAGIGVTALEDLG